MHALAYHAQALLYDLLECAPDGHHLAYGFHRRTQFAVYAAKLSEVPARYLAHHVVQRRLEESRGSLSHGVFQVEEPVAQSELCRNECKRIACGFRGEGGGAREACVHLNHAIVFRLGVEGILHVTFAHDADVAHDANGKLAEFVVFIVGERLRGGYHDALARVNAERVEVFHVAHRDTVVEAVAHHFVFYFFPAFQALLHEHLRGEGECLFSQFVQLLFIVAEARAEAAEGVGGTQNDGVAQCLGCGACLPDAFAGLALYGLDVDFVELVYKEFAVLRIHNGLHGRAKHLDTVFFEDALAVKFHAAVECGLSAEGKHDALRLLFFDDFFHEERRDGKEVDMVCHAFRRLNRGDVGIDEHRLDAFFAQRFEGLRAGVVKFAGFADFQCAGTEEQNFLYGLFHSGCLVTSRRDLRFYIDDNRDNFRQLVICIAVFIMTTTETTFDNF